MKKIFRVFLLFALCAFPLFPSAFSAQAQTPKLVHSISLTSSSESGNGFKISYGGSMGTGTLANNLFTLRLTAPHGSTISSIVDNRGSTYLLGVSTDSGVGGWITSLYYVAGGPAGITLITVNYSAPVLQWHASMMEYSGVATSSPSDGTCSNHTTTIACSAAITTTGSNDLVVASAIAAGGLGIYLNPMSTVVPGGSFMLDAADTQSSDADEEFVQLSPGSVTPSFTVTGNSQVFNVVGMAFKAQAGAGTNPTGMYILHIQHVQMSNSGTQNMYFVSNGNLVVAAYELGVTASTANISGCTPANNWTKRSEGTFWPQFFYLSSSGTFSTNLHCTVTGSGPGNNAHMVIYDVVGAAASPEDTLSSGQSQGNGGFVTGTVTPTKKPGIMFAAASDGIGPVTQVGASGTPGEIFDNTTYTGETDAGQLNNGDAWQHMFYNATSPVTFTWSMSNPTSYMEASAITFASAAGTSQGPTPPTGLQATVK